MSDIRKTYEGIEDQYLEITKQYLRVDESNIDQALLKHTGVYAFFGAVLAYAKQREDAAFADLERSEAAIRESKRSESTDDGKKITDKTLDAYVKTIPEIQQKQDYCRECSYKYNLAKNIISALDHQKDMLVQISANKRAETKLIGEN